MEVGIVGLGLIGGSIAKSLKKNKVCEKIIVYDNNKEILHKAKNEKIIDNIAIEINSSFSNCDIIFICTPVEYIVSVIIKLREFVKKECIITDVGSTKQKIENEILEKVKNINYIGGHPMAGLEKSGYEYCSAILLENAFYLLSTNRYTKTSSINRIKSIIKKMKAIPIVLEAKVHDNITSNISHVPHILAASLVNMVKKNDNADQLMRVLAAGGFRDISRIASSSPKIWEDICLSNKEEILSTINDFKEEILKFERVIENDDNEKLNSLFSSAKKYRDSIDIRSLGLIEKIHEFSLSVEDKPGIIADIATILANDMINIKNIGIINNREAYEGALRIEFYNENSMKKAHQILDKLDYKIHLKD